MLRLPSFKLRSVTRVEDAVEILVGEGNKARIVSGGTDLYPNMKRRHQKAETVVSLRGIESLHGIHGEPGQEIQIGAMTTLDEIVAHEGLAAAYPAFVRAVESVSSPILRNMGTIGGNLCLDTRCTYLNQSEEWRRSIDYCMKAEGSICWVAPSSPRCWAVSSSDSAPILCAIDAKVRLVGKDGERVISCHDLFNDDGMEYLTKDPDEILTEVILPVPDGSRSSFWKLRRRGSIDFAVLSAAPSLKLDKDNVVESARIYMGAVKSFPSRAAAVEELLVGKTLNEETIAAASEKARKDSIPMDNTDFVARWRGKMTVKYMEAALLEIAGLETGRLSPRHGRSLVG
jgi:4-hydroxybenzoyl-CoA reductase subunit beta